MKQKFSARAWVSTISVLMALKRIALGIALFMTGWLVYDLFVRRLLLGNRLDRAIAFFVIWILAAYIVIPLVHRILTKLYIPDYFIGRIRTIDGLLSDPVNLAFVGSEKQLHKAMQNAGWFLADNINVKTSIRACIATIFHKSYASAPVSPGYLFNQKQAFTY